MHGQHGPGGSGCCYVVQGSSNQQIHFLSPRYRQLESSVRESRERQLEVSVSPGGAIDITGIPSAGFIDRLRDQLSTRGLVLESEAPKGNQSGAI